MSSVFNLLFLLPFLLFFSSDGGPASPVISWTCGSDSYTSGSPYESNLNLLLVSLSSSNVSLSGGFKSTSAGREPDGIQGLVLCRGDVNVTECASCLQPTARDILSYCPRSKNATIWYDTCYLHYSDRPFLSSADNEPRVMMHNATNEADTKGLVKLFRDAIMNSLADKAARLSANKFATAVVNLTTQFATMYGMAQCTPDLTAEACGECLRELNDMMPQWLEGKQGGKAMGIRCAMRLESYHFYRGTPVLVLTSTEDLISSDASTNSKSSWLIGVGIVICALSLLIGGCLWSYWFWKKRQLIKLRTKFFKQNGGLFLEQQLSAQGINATTKMFTIEELSKASANFDESQILGQGGFGTVYKGTLKDHIVVAIKKSRQLHEKQSEQFINEIIILSQINHKNIVKLLGCCLDIMVPLLVYEFIPNGNFFQHIHGGDSLPWEDRIRIAAETAGALAYLHGATSTPIIHRDVKSANILLDEHFTVKVSDFGASRSVPFDHTHVTTLVQGTCGYLDPEYGHTCQLTEKSDVYSFGVVLVELLTRELPVFFESPEVQTNLASYFVRLFDENRLMQLIDPKLLEQVGEEELLIVAEVARNCLNLKGEERPSMKEVAMQLEGLRIKCNNKKDSVQQNVKGLLLLNVEELTDSFIKEMLSSMEFPKIVYIMYSQHNIYCV